MKKAFVTLSVLTCLLQATLAMCVYAAGPPDIEKHIFIHYANNAYRAKPPATEKGYYKLLGAKWQTLPVTIEVNTANDGLTEHFVLSAVGLAAEEWDDGEYSKNDGDPNTNWAGVEANLISQIDSSKKGYDALAWSSEKLDGANTIVFGDYPTQGVIAVTIVWYNRATRAIIEFDMVLDTDFTWGDAAVNSGVMDLQNIVTHELGHALGLNDLYLSAAYRETMYGYASEGETIKRSLYIGDQAGITKLYG